MALSLGGGKNKSRTSQSFDQTQSTRLSDRAYGTLMDRIGAIGGQQYRKLDPGDYKAYMNPFDQDVIDATTADIMAARGQAANTDRAMLAGAGAFGDDRRGIVEAETAGQYDRTLANTLAGLRSRGFSEATGIAQGENTNQNAFNADLQRRIDALMALLANETTTKSSGTSLGKSSGRSFNFTGSFDKGKGG